MIPNEIEMYNAVYSEFKENGVSCRVSCHVLEKARRNVTGAMRSFGLPSIAGARVLDVGCGLGYFAEALREQGASVTAVDNSSVAIDILQESFPGVHAELASFPEGCVGNGKYDLIWACDFSLLNHFDVDMMCRDFYQPALNLLSASGSLVVGWHSNFDGTMGNSHWAHWPLSMIKELKHKTGLLGPRVVSIPSSFLSDGVIRVSRALRKSIPIYFSLTKLNNNKPE